jgi:hypothetical protein
MCTLLLSIALLASPAPAVEVEMLDGARTAGGLLELDAGGLKLHTDRGPVSFEIAKLAGVESLESRVKSGESGVESGESRVKSRPLDSRLPALDPSAAAPPGVWLELVDGSVLAGSAYTATGGVARLTLPSGEPLDVPTQDVKWVRFEPQKEALTGPWSRILGMDVKSDLLVVKAGETIDYHKGLLRDVTAEVVKFELDGELLPIKRAKVYGAAYYHPAGRELPRALASLSETSGAVWSVRTIALSGERLDWTTPTGLKLARPLAAVKRIDFSKGKIVYLSDLEPESVQWSPYIRLGKDFPSRAAYAGPRRDRSRDGGLLQLDGKSYSKGLALSSRTLVVYRLPDRYSRFSAAVGIDDRVRPQGNVRLVVRGDEKTLLEATVAGTEAAKPLSLDVAGVRRLSILVDFGDDLDVAGYLDLGDAKLVK